MELPDDLKGFHPDADVLPHPQLLDSSATAAPADLHSLEQALLLGWCLHVRKGSAADGMQPWEMAAYVDAGTLGGWVAAAVPEEWLCLVLLSESCCAPHYTYASLYSPRKALKPTLVSPPPASHPCPPQSPARSAPSTCCMLRRRCRRAG